MAIAKAGGLSVDELAERLSRVCTFMGAGELEETARAAGAAELVAAVLAALRGDEPMARSVLERRLDTLDDRMAAAGFGNVTRGTRGMPTLPGNSPGHPVAHRWNCPAAHPCELLASAESHPEAPVCAMTGRPFVYGPSRL
ncbi:hypothetical protein OG824_26035 [Streptomyces prunicolor]|jgi:hypothetical protein|uniref:hypothetical protein n=1 Tax=Streptomyces prunicolor TaxID=67348 RepID=UPI00225B2E3E|nr:hypothetical protein [Streptomyces prunicolor]MCX5238665.1 hypothetical protein [Streptomyces prunicolor]